MKKIYWIHQYSLDIATSAVALSLVLSYAFHSSFSQYFSDKSSLEVTLLPPFFLLFFSVLFVYHLDHFLDKKKVLKKLAKKEIQQKAKRTEPTTQSPSSSNDSSTLLPKRHLTVILLSAGFNILIITYIISTTTLNLAENYFLIFSGSLLLGIIGIYLFNIYFFEEKTFLLKEALVSLLFSLGIFIPLLSLLRLDLITHPTLLPLLCFTFIQLWMITFHNAIIYSYFRKSNDDLNAVKSLWNWSNLSSNKIGSRIVTLIGLLTLFFILSASSISEVSLPKSWSTYLGFIIILQQIIFNLGKKRTTPRIEILCLDSVFIIGLLSQFLFF